MVYRRENRGLQSRSELLRLCMSLCQKQDLNPVDSQSWFLFLATAFLPNPVLCLSIVVQSQTDISSNLGPTQSCCHCVDVDTAEKKGKNSYPQGSYILEVRWGGEATHTKSVLKYKVYQTAVTTLEKTTGIQKEYLKSGCKFRQDYQGELTENMRRRGGNKQYRYLGEEHSSPKILHMQRS